jgi:hypothetical protein
MSAERGTLDGSDVGRPIAYGAHRRAFQRLSNPSVGWGIPSAARAVTGLIHRKPASRERCDSIVDYLPVERDIKNASSCSISCFNVSGQWLAQVRGQRKRSIHAALQRRLRRR